MQTETQGPESLVRVLPTKEDQRRPGEEEQGPDAEWRSGPSGRCEPGSAPTASAQPSQRWRYLPSKEARLRVAACRCQQRCWSQEQPPTRTQDDGGRAPEGLEPGVRTATARSPGSGAGGRAPAASCSSPQQGPGGGNGAQRAREARRCRAEWGKGGPTLAWVVTKEKRDKCDLIQLRASAQ